MPTLHFPKYLSARSTQATIDLCQQIMSSIEGIQIDASQLKFVDPFGLALLGAAFHHAYHTGNRVLISGLSTGAGAYLNRMDVFKGVEIDNQSLPSQHRHNRQDTLVELKRLSHATEVGNTARQLAYAVVGKFPDISPNEAPDEMTGYTTSEKLAEPLQYILSELLENALTHAKRQGYLDANVWVAAQFFPSSGLIRLGVVDNGCGFLKSLHSHPELHSQSHHVAILTALKPRISCNRDLGLNNGSVNQGVGLTTALRIAEHTDGEMLIVSGNAYHNSSRKSGTWSDDSCWQGVAMAIECKRSRLADVSYRELLPKLEGVKPVSLRFE